MNLHTSTRAFIALTAVVITLTLFQSVSSLGRVQHPERVGVMAAKAVPTLVAAR